ncbi:sugar phosphate isomerase/epimerase family protein [Bacillus taeanensis]|uniref:Sugar phosphate isomerase/epimerase n=1 Tax=Bacillus taeanensis TaxID=273032 RepID=A0A366XY76_9BACI|nr:sugar phosphate isomerase/epimerase [Bacillus taeanensis]RBW69719.1 sugar phosphate isomerase/epimerase [Bacillus taeanensis]
MSVGVLAHLFGKLPYKELAYKIGSYGFNHVQLALWKALNNYDFSKAGLLSPGLAEDIAEEFDKHDVSISVLACYLHLFERDEERRRENIERFKELLRYARCFGSHIIAAEVGKLPNNDFNEHDWITLKATIEELVEEAEKWGVYIGLEPANEHLIGTAASLNQMLSEVPSSHLGVVLDPGNLLTTENFYEQDRVIEEAFGLLGNRIVACHAKDRILGGNGQIQTVPPGQGQMNYPLYLKLLEQYKPQARIIMEAAKEHQMVDCKHYIEKICNSVVNSSI